MTDAAGKITAEFTIGHCADGIAVLLRRLARYGEPGGMPVAIEHPDGRPVDLLLEAGHPVAPVKPNAIKACGTARCSRAPSPTPGTPQ